MNNFKKLIPFAILSLVGHLNAQKNYSLQECIDYALKNNENIKTANYHLQHDKQFKKTATEIPKTTVMYTQGQFNSIYKYDNNITISQTLPNPMVFTSHNALAKAQIKSCEYKLEATKAELIYQVKTTYYALLYSNAVHDILMREDSIYDGFAKSVTAKFEAGRPPCSKKQQPKRR
jgi:cobalt-zinc-cadmium resistance protein CzcA